MIPFVSFDFILNDARAVAKGGYVAGRRLRRGSFGGGSRVSSLTESVLG